MTAMGRPPACVPGRPLSARIVSSDGTPTDGNSRAVWQKGDTGCLEACIATLLECDLSELPSPPPVGHSKVEELETQERLHAWVRSRGRRMHYQHIGRQRHEQVLDRHSCWRNARL